MKKLFVLIALAAALLTGCASQSASTGAAPSGQTATSDTPSPSASIATRSPSPVATTSGASREDQIKTIYLASLRTSDPALKLKADADLVDIGQSFCKMYDGGAKGSDINAFILKGAGWAYTVQQLESIHGASVGAFCPQYIDKMGS